MNSKASAATLFQKRGSGGSVSQTPDSPTQDLHTGLDVTHFSTAWGPRRQQKPWAWRPLLRTRGARRAPRPRRWSGSRPPPGGGHTHSETLTHPRPTGPSTAPLETPHQPALGRSVRTQSP